MIPDDLEHFFPKKFAQSVRYIALFQLLDRKCIFYLVTQIVIWKMVSHQTVTDCNQIDTRASQLPKVNEFSSFKWGKLGEIFYWIFLWMIFLCSNFINMICSLSMAHSHSSKITKWPNILVIPLVGSPKPRTKSKNSSTHPGTEKREAKVVILGDFRGRFRVLIRSFQTWTCGYEEI